MLKQISIKNLAIIDDLTIDFEDNFNVLTGETGAGKSIIIDAISLIFGKRADNDIIASGQSSAFISAALYVDEMKADYIFENYDLDVKDEFIISRTISKEGKSSIKINGQMVPLKTVSEISSLLIDISSQNEASYLFNKKSHLNLLDSFISSKEEEFKKDYQKAYGEYKEVLEKYSELSSTKINADELDFLNFKYQELKDFSYTVEDVEAIVKEYKELNALSANMETIEEIVNYLDNSQNGAVNSLYEAIKTLSKISSTTELNDYYEKFNSIYLDLEDLSEEFKRKYSDDNFDGNRLEYLSNEITKINRLKRKYNTEDVLAYKKGIEDRINLLSNIEIEMSKLEHKLSELKENAYKKALKLSALRKKYAKDLALQVKNELKDLYLNDASFSIHFEECEMGNEGIDDIEFYMSANKGVEERPLIKVASGGEVSRIMLGLKSVFAKLSNIDIIIFDEIDTGVSGKVAQAMGLKMKSIAKNNQVLAITHLPQVAALSDNHFYIYKETKANRTKTIIHNLNEEEKVMEVARLLSGNDISESFINAAKDLINNK